jgi:serine/threonine protein kinase
MLNQYCKAMFKIGKTSARLGKWRMGDALVRDWAELNHDQEGEIHQEEIGEDLASIITLEKELGAGSFGRVFACDIQMPDGTVEKHVVKVPGALMKSGALSVDPQTHQLISMPTNTAALVEIRTNFRREFESFENIYEPTSFVQEFAGGKRGYFKDAQALRRLKEERAILDRHPGRQHIHEYLHFDAQIPAIVSSFCTDTLDGVREKHSDWFSVQCFMQQNIMRTTPTWNRITKELANAVDYIHSRGYVHTDIKPANVLVVGNTRDTFSCKLSDFGEIMRNEPAREMTTGYTPFFTPPAWPQKAGHRQFLEPATFADYGFAATAVALLHFKGLDRWPLYAKSHLEYDIALLRQQKLGQFVFPSLWTDVYAKKNPLWTHILSILSLDYSTVCYSRDPTANYLRNFIDEPSP